MSEAPDRKPPWFVRILYPDVVIPAVTLIVVAWMVYRAMGGS